MRATTRPVEVFAYQFLGWKEDETGDNAVEIGEKIPDCYQWEFIGWEAGSIYDPYTHWSLTVEIGQWIVIQWQPRDPANPDYKPEYRAVVMNDNEFHRLYEIKKGD